MQTTFTMLPRILHGFVSEDFMYSVSIHVCVCARAYACMCIHLKTKGIFDCVLIPMIKE